VRSGERADAAIEGGNIVIDAIGAGQAHDRLDNCYDIARSMIDFFGQQDLALFGPLSLGDVGRNTAEPDQATAFVKARRCRPGTPTYLAIWPHDPELGLEGVGILGHLAKCAHQ
jgi:hypothetical protein